MALNMWPPPDELLTAPLAESNGREDQAHEQNKTRAFLQHATESDTSMDPPDPSTEVRESVDMR